MHCRRAAWRDAGWPGWISVNLSARELAEPGLAETVAAMLDETGIDARPALARADRERVDARQSSRPRTSSRPCGRSASTSVSTTSGPETRRCRASSSSPPTSSRSTATSSRTSRPTARSTRPAATWSRRSCQVGTTLGLSVIAEGIQTAVEAEILRRVRVPVRPGRAAREAGRPAGHDPRARPPMTPTS